MELTTMYRRDLTGIIISAIIIAAVILMMNPSIMERISDATCKSALAVLKAVDRFTVDYQLSRGLWADAKGDGVPEAEKGGGE